MISTEGPVFSSPIYRASVPEDAPTGTPITRIHADISLNHSLLYSIMSGDPDSIFELHYVTGKFLSYSM